MKTRQAKFGRKHEPNNNFVKHSQKSESSLLLDLLDRSTKPKGPVQRKGQPHPKGPRFGKTYG